MTDTVTITVDGRDYQVPRGANLVDAAKLHGIKIPVFCYHPKMKPVGMCRMCLVELGTITMDRETGKPQLDDQGQPAVRWFPTLQTACTQTCADGMVIRTTTEKVVAGRNSILEFLLTSHPLDCPICDKGGECPLQNLTMGYGPGESRFVFDDKMRLEKHVPLGQLIFLDRERCIQCARCTRFCDEVAGDDVLGFHERGRRLQIVTISDPPFDTKFSGNTTDICPVGALTTADFRFGARPWELQETATICPHCPVGCNLSASTRMDRDAGGKTVIKRIMPRQNERVNEIWICDKGRFGHHFTRSENRIECPSLRKDGALVETDWTTARAEVSKQLQGAKGRVGFLAGPSLSNEDLWEMRQLAEQVGGEALLGVWPATMTGADAVAQAGVGVETRLQDMGAGDAIVVVASDFEEEAPVWWLQVKQASERGVNVIVANARPTKLDRYAHASIRYDYAGAAGWLNGLVVAVVNNKQTADDSPVAARVDGLKDLRTSLKKTQADSSDLPGALAGANNLVIFAGAEGLTLEQHGALMRAAANLLIATGHAGRPLNGLVPVWPGANIQGAFDMGFSSEATAAMLQNPPETWVIAGCDPVAEDADAAAAIAQASYVVALSPLVSDTTAAANAALPSQTFAERDGSYTNGMRRVQRFYAAQSTVGEGLPDWRIFADLTAALGGKAPRVSAAGVMRDITQSLPRYADMGFSNLAWVEDQFPDVGGDDLYYGGTSYTNRSGLGVQWLTDAEDPAARLPLQPVPEAASPAPEGLQVVPVWTLFDHGLLFNESELMHHRVPEPYAEINAEDAAALGIADGDRIRVSAGNAQVEVVARVDGRAPVGTVLLPRNLAEVPTPNYPAACTVQKVGE
ncbi:NADH-quinone oxidoreductase subunit NuoG [Aggregatilinea lenta]|uniref:NADH-quinone oxidoreductase subunit NuoG n=1 Tax=Aggregatilinea lenta TaxID=913108 RepID=UPI000E5BC7D4|nr:NADH-quinone oxidoreductase subunit NuoG [Aggregatilinea lenta]